MLVLASDNKNSMREIVKSKTELKAVINLARNLAIIRASTAFL